jgi:hypothetical protein
MAVYFNTTAGKALLAKFDAAIKQKEAKGKITTWKKSDDDEFYTHVADNWTKKAWFQAKVEDKRLVFNIIKPKNSNVSTSAYAYYHGHMIETFLNHFDADFTTGDATGLPASGDKCS